MKTIFLFLIFALILKFSVAQNFEMYKNDTINRTDKDNLKQGKWLTFDEAKLKVVEEGNFLNNKKHGIWKKYFFNGNLQSEITFQNGIPDGYAKIYHENGKVAEEGMWKVDKWVGNYKFFHENGNPSYVWNFDASGKRTGKQQYFHENGKLRIEGEWKEGKEAGVVKEYNEDGSLKSEKNFNDGKFDETTSKEYAVPPAKKVENPPAKKVENVDTVKKSVEQPKKQEKEREYGVFTGNGYFKFLNANGKVDCEGNFVRGNLYEGKKFFYNKEGNLIKTEIYEGGRMKKTIINK